LFRVRRRTSLGGFSHPLFKDVEDIVGSTGSPDAGNQRGGVSEESEKVRK
jgi:hypothetical protein